MLNELVEKVVALAEGNSELLVSACIIAMACCAAITMFRVVAWMWRKAAVRRRTLRHARRLMQGQCGETGCNSNSSVPRHNHKCKQYGRTQSQGQGEIVGM